MKLVRCDVVLCEIGEASDGKARVRLVPDGHTKNENGDEWDVSREGFADMERRFAARKLHVPVDYHHQSLDPAATASGKAPAAGWIEAIEYVVGEGIFGTVEWTDDARAEIRSKKYKYLSPVVRVDKQGVARDLHSAALTNKPAISGMDVLTAELNIAGDEVMELMKQLAQKMGLAESASQEDILKTALGKVDGAGATAADKAIASSVRTKLKLKADAGESEVLTALAAQAEASTAAPELTRLRAELDTLKAHEATRTAETLREKFVKLNKINPANKDLMANSLEWAKKDPDGFEKFFNSADPIVPAGRTVAPPRETVPGGDEDALIANATKDTKDFGGAVIKLQEQLMKPMLEQGLTTAMAQERCKERYPKIFGGR